jgi:hypothetical protein
VRSRLRASSACQSGSSCVARQRTYSASSSRSFGCKPSTACLISARLITKKFTICGWANKAGVGLVSCSKIKNLHRKCKVQFDETSESQRCERIRHDCMRYAVLLAFIANMFSGCEQPSDLAERVKEAGGVEALKADCLQLAAELETSGLKSISLSSRTNHPPTIAALGPKNIQVGRQDDVVVVHMSFVRGPHPYGLYVAPRGCPSTFQPKRPLGSRVSKLSNDVFEYAD